VVRCEPNAFLVNQITTTQQLFIERYIMDGNTLAVCCTMGLRARRGRLFQSDGLGSPSYGRFTTWLKCYNG
jgi:hypothetical protein